MLNSVKQLIVWVLLALGLHGLLLMALSHAYQPVELRLQSGEQAIAVQFNRAEQVKEVDDSSTLAEVATQVHTSTHRPVPQQTSVIQSPKPPVKPSKMPTKSASKPSKVPLAQPKKSTPQRPTPSAPNPAMAPVMTQPTPQVNEKPTPKVAVKPQGVYVVAQPLSNNRPKYPRRAIMRNQQGRVKVNLSVDRQGYVDDIELIDSSGYALLDQSVFRFAKQERFKPATHNGQPIASTQSYIFRFVLN